jgi:hypothetical protein
MSFHISNLILLELNIRPNILRRQERKDVKFGSSSSSNGQRPKANSAMSSTRHQSVFQRWTDLMVHRDNFSQALLYSVLLLVLAASLVGCFRARQAEHRRKLERPRSDINGFKYFSPRRSQQGSSSTTQE